MMIIEMREAAQEKALELVDELHELGHEKKMILCELEDTLYDCFESSDKEHKEEESEEGTLCVTLTMKIKIQKSIIVIVEECVCVETEWVDMYNLYTWGLRPPGMYNKLLTICFQD